ncbi:hypothetical protein ACFWCA_32705 [Streptomyces phaeochromogenes]|uniref:hypothetical protein n=1 Tax=Streptomyces phaeochromogenes TaxID=1923 RepID=UPI00368F1017
MDTKPWRERVHDEEQLLTQLNRLVSEAATRRAQALQEGVDELGTVAEVARDLGRSWNAVDKAIKKLDRKNPPGQPDTSTTE